MKTALHDLRADITAGRLEKPACPGKITGGFPQIQRTRRFQFWSVSPKSMAVFQGAGAPSPQVDPRGGGAPAPCAAAALTPGARVFVSFDDRQRKLARRARLKVLPRIRPSAVQPRGNAMGLWFPSSSNRAHRRAAELAGHGDKADFVVLRQVNGWERVQVRFSVASDLAGLWHRVNHPPTR